jgi:hypothetical protein
MSLSTNASVLIGSSLGGVLAVTPGPWLVYALDAAGFAVSFAALSTLPPLPPATGAGATEDQKEQEISNGPVLREILTSLRYAVGRKDLLGSYLADLAAMIFAYPNAMLPFLAIELHAPWSTGLMFAAPSAGAFAVSVTSGWMPRVRRHGLAIALAATGWGLAMAAVGIAPSVYVALAFLAIAGGADECSAVFRTPCGISPSSITCTAGWRASSCSATPPVPRQASCDPARSRPSPARGSPSPQAGSPARPSWSRSTPPSPPSGLIPPRSPPLTRSPPPRLERQRASCCYLRQTRTRLHGCGSHVPIATWLPHPCGWAGRAAGGWAVGVGGRSGYPRHVSS